MAEAGGNFVDEGLAGRLFAPLQGLARTGIAVSGGSDSTALMHLYDLWQKAAPGRPPATVLCVDHGLRPESALEASRVTDGARARGMDARVLVWQHGAISGDIQAKARDARYRLLADAAQDLALGVVLLGHTRDDVAETFLIRLARGSGLHGLSSMAAERRVHGVRFLRPLLGLSRDSLRVLLAADGVGWSDDPSNLNMRFQRVKMRMALPFLAGLGLTAERLAGTAQALGEARGVLDDAVDALDAAAVTSGPGWCSVDTGALLGARPLVAVLLLARLTGDIRPADYPPEHGAIREVLDRLRAAAGNGLFATLGGVRFLPGGPGLLMAAEAGRGGFPDVALAGGETHVWDGRFSVTAGAAGRVRPAGPAEREAMAKAGCSLPAVLSGTLPVLDRADGQTLLPFLDSSGDFEIRAVRPRFAAKKSLLPAQFGS